MGTPDVPERFVCFEAGELTIYVAQELMQELKPEAERIAFYIDGYGRFWLVFTEPFHTKL